MKCVMCKKEKNCTDSRLCLKCVWQAVKEGGLTKDGQWFPLSMIEFIN